MAILACALVTGAGLWATAWAWVWYSMRTQVTVLPYVQPGTNAAAVHGRDSSRLVWIVHGRPADFSVAYGPTPAYGRTATIAMVDLVAAGHSRKCVATLSDEEVDSRVYYRVGLGSKTVRASSFAARKSATNQIHFVAVGETVRDRGPERQIAWQIARQWPDFLLHLGDIAYDEGTVHEYGAAFWPCYNDPTRFSPEEGAPLMGEVPFYVVLGNHDTMYALNLAKRPDGLAAFYFFHSPLNGPRGLKCSIPVTGTPEQMAAFRLGAGESFPGLCFYSFDNGPAHFLCLDANSYTDFHEPALRDWIEHDLTNARTPWKFVASHQPAFQTASREYDYQQLRVLAPLFQRCGVDVVFSGHTHNYQRTKPLKFQPAETNAPTHPFWVNGRFEVDKLFDGVSHARPDGIIHIVSGGGGAPLFDRHLDGKTILPSYDSNNWAPYTERIVASTYSFSEVTVTPERFTFRQIDAAGWVIDRFDIRKSPSGQEPRR